MNDKRACSCGWRGRTESLLSARLVVRAPGEEVIGSYLVCPDCKDPCDVATACDEPGCWDPVTCGTPTAGGYRSTCGQHMPKGDDDLAIPEAAVRLRHTYDPRTHRDLVIPEAAVRFRHTYDPRTHRAISVEGLEALRDAAEDLAEIRQWTPAGGGLAPDDMAPALAEARSLLEEQDDAD